MKVQRVYNKLVRDNIPKLIAASGAKFKIEQCTDEEIISFSARKLIEEVQELINEMMSEPENVEQILSECADIYTILIKLASLYGIEEEDIMKFEQVKVLTNGGFDKEYILKWVEEDIEPDDEEELEELVINTAPKRPPKK